MVEPQASARLLPLRPLQSFPPPDSLDAVLADTPARILEFDRDAPISINAVPVSLNHTGTEFSGHSRVDTRRSTDVMAIED